MGHPSDGDPARDRIFEMYHQPVPAAGLRPLWAGIRFFLGCHVVVFVVVVLSLVIGAPAWVAGALTFVALVGLAAFIVLRPMRRSGRPT